MAANLNSLKSNDIALRKKLEFAEEDLVEYKDDIVMFKNDPDLKKMAISSANSTIKEIADLKAAIDKNTKDIAAATKAATASSKR